MVSLRRSPFKKGRRVIVLAGQYAGRKGEVVDEPMLISRTWEVMVLLDDETGMDIKTIVKFGSTDLLAR